MPKEPKITALYERLSRDDDLAGESNSITKHTTVKRMGLLNILIVVVDMQVG